MMEPKAKTMQEKFGFSDPDLKTPKHDAIMMWLDGEVERIARERDEHNKEWRFSEDIEYLQYHEGDKEAVRNSAAALIEREKCDILESLGLDAKPTMRISKRWEQPIVDRTFTIGFADMLVACEMPYVWCSMKITHGADIVKLVETKKRYSATWCAYFEVKPSIPSVGELVRQLRMYQTYTGRTEWFVVSPDDRFESILKAQGFGFIKVPVLP